MTSPLLGSSPESRWLVRGPLAGLALLLAGALSVVAINSAGNFGPASRGALETALREGLWRTHQISLWDAISCVGCEVAAPIWNALVFAGHALLGERLLGPLWVTVGMAHLAAGACLALLLARHGVGRIGAAAAFLAVASWALLPASRALADPWRGYEILATLALLVSMVCLARLHFQHPRAAAHGAAAATGFAASLLVGLLSWENLWPAALLLPLQALVVERAWRRSPGSQAVWFAAWAVPLAVLAFVVALVPCPEWLSARAAGAQLALPEALAAVGRGFARTLQSQWERAAAPGAASATAGLAAVVAVLALAGIAARRQWRLLLVVGLMAGGVSLLRGLKSCTPPVDGTTAVFASYLTILFWCAILGAALDAVLARLPARATVAIVALLLGVLPLRAWHEHTRRAAALEAESPATAETLAHLDACRRLVALGMDEPAEIRASEPIPDVAIAMPALRRQFVPLSALAVGGLIHLPSQATLAPPGLLSDERLASSAEDWQAFDDELLIESARLLAEQRDLERAVAWLAAFASAQGEPAPLPDRAVSLAMVDIPLHCLARRCGDEASRWLALATSLDRDDARGWRGRLLRSPAEPFEAGRWIAFFERLAGGPAGGGAAPADAPQQGQVDAPASARTALEPASASQHLAWGVELAREDAFDSALAHLQAAADLDGANLQARELAGQLCVRQLRYGKAAEHFLAALKLAPMRIDIRAQLAYALDMDGQSEAAIERYRQILHVNDEWSEGQNNLAWLLATHPDAGLRDGQEAVRRATLIANRGGFQNPTWIDTLAAACAETGRFDEAVTHARRAAALFRERGQAAQAEKATARLNEYLQRRPHRDPRFAPAAPAAESGPAGSSAP